jgi:hypothetical protein
MDGFKISASDILAGDLLVADWGGASRPQTTDLARGGLAPWQVRTLNAHIDANLEAGPSSRASAARPTPTSSPSASPGLRP